MFPDMLSYLRKREKLTQDELARALGIGRSTLASYERGLREPNFEMLETIADYFNVNMSTLLGETERNETPELSAKRKAALDTVEKLSEEKLDAVIKILESDEKINALLKLLGE